MKFDPNFLGKMEIYMSIFQAIRLEQVLLKIVKISYLTKAQVYSWAVADNKQGKLL